MNDIFSQLFENVNLINEEISTAAAAPVDAPQGPSKDETLISALRNSIQLEQSAADTYERYANETDDEDAKAIFQSVADEEKVHIGEFKAVLDKYSPQSEFEEEGKQEAEGIMGQGGDEVAPEEGPAEPEGEPEPNIAWNDDNVPDIEDEEEEAPAEPDMDEEELPEEEEEVTAEDEETEEDEEEKED